MTTLYKAIHPTTGNVCLRSSNRPAYRFAAIGPSGEKNVSFSATAAGAANLIPKRSDGWAVVPAIEVSKDEFAAANKANKQFFKVKYLGKAYSKSLPAKARPYVCAVGYDRPEITVFITCSRQGDERLEWLRTHGTPGSVERAIECNERGGYDHTYRAERGVQWFRNRDEAQAYLTREPTHATDKATTYTLLDLA